MRLLNRMLVSFLSIFLGEHTWHFTSSESLREKSLQAFHRGELKWFIYEERRGHGFFGFKYLSFLYTKHATSEVVVVDEKTGAKTVNYLSSDCVGRKSIVVFFTHLSDNLLERQQRNLVA